MRALIDRYLDAYNRLDVDGMLLTLHPQVVFENIAAGAVNVRTQGVEEFRRLAESTRPLFATRRQTITAYAEHDGVAQAAIAFEGVFALDLPNGVRAGQAIALAGRSEYRVHDGLLIHIADISD
jgi:ketosteroid isomerase-like protein